MALSTTVPKRNSPHYSRVTLHITLIHFPPTKAEAKTAKHTVPHAAATCILSLLLAFTSLLEFVTEFNPHQPAGHGVFTLRAAIMPSSR